MSKCPKCGQKLHLYNISQYCPQCKTNLMYINFEKKFFEDAKKAEMSLANVRVKLEKIKVALIGGKLQIARLSCILIALLALLVPIGSVTFTLPVYSKTVSVSALGFFSAFSDGTLHLLGSTGDAMLIGQASAQLATALYSLAVAAVAAVLIVVFTILSFISFRKMAAILCACSIVGTGAGVVSAVFVGKISDVGSLLSAKFGFGVFILSAAFLVVFALNLIIIKNGLAIVYKEGDLERVAVRKQYRKKAVSLDDIPFPIYETEEEHAAREAAIAQTQSQTVEALGVISDE